MHSNDRPAFTLNHARYLSSYVCFFVLFICFNFAYASSKPQIPLANVYKPGKELSDYWVSEKLDGVRAYWDGEKLISKQGNIYQAPEWFTKDFPKHPLDGELWISRNSFERVMEVVRDQTPGKGWKKVNYMIFDLPDPDLNFTARLNRLKEVIENSRSPYLKMVEQSHIESHEALMSKLDKVIDLGGEGLMLHKGSAMYKAGRSNDLLKVKRYDDAEARVIKHLPGKGKYTGMLGAILVEMEDGIRFKIGSGFSDKLRKNPPPIGSLITFKYYGKTTNNVPKFASFLRIRELFPPPP